MAKEYVPIFYDWTEVTEELNDQEKGRLIDAIVLYARGEDWQDRIKGNERYLFPAFREQINRNGQLSQDRAIAGAIGGSKRKQTEANESKPKQTEAKSPKEKEKEEDKKEKEKEKEQEKENRFALFWEAYPRKEGKPAAHRSFMSINPDESLLQKMLDAIAKWKTTEQWSNPQFIPHPATWLNQRRWEDEPPKTKGRVSAQQYEQRDYAGGENPDDILDQLRGAG